MHIYDRETLLATLLLDIQQGKSTSYADHIKSSYMYEELSDTAKVEIAKLCKLVNEILRLGNVSIQLVDILDRLGNLMLNNCRWQGNKPVSRDIRYTYDNVDVEGHKAGQIDRSLYTIVQRKLMDEYARGYYLGVVDALNGVYRNE